MKTENENKKAYGLIFSCLRVRAIHLETTSEMSADRTLLAIRRFTARRGTPSTILSDNARSFILTKSILDRTWKCILESEKMRTFANRNDIVCKFTTERAPWRGAVYERLIQNVKYCLRRFLEKKRLELEELNTVLTEVEMVVNSRPITATHEGEMVQPLRPIDFLLPEGKGPLVDDKEIIDLQDPEFLPRKEQP